MSSTPEWEFEEWFCETHGTQKQPITSNELECDSCVEDDYSENSYQQEDPPLSSDGFLLE